MTDLLRAAAHLDRTASAIETNGGRSALLRPTAEVLRAVALLDGAAPDDRGVWNGARWVRWAEVFGPARSLAARVLEEVE